MTVLYLLSGLAVLLGLFSLRDGLRNAAWLTSPACPSSPDWCPSIAVFCPCKGSDPELEENLRSILGQDHPRFAANFVVESEDDSALAVLRRAGATNISIAGLATSCGQKVHNLQYAVARVGRSADLLVFCDSDARFPPDWLRRLSAPLADPQITVTTGYRWYVCRRFHLPSLVRSVWNASVLGMLGGQRRNFAWGGSMAIRRTAFEQMGVLDAWKGSVSDDFSLTRATQAAGKWVTFVPSCLIPSYGECSWRDLLEFTTRQIVITRVYHSRLWRLGFFAQTVFNAAFFVLPAAMPGRPWLFLVWLLIFSLSAARSAARFFAVRKVLNDPSLSRFGWFYILLSPVGSLLYQYNFLLSALTREITWRHIQYTLISPNETRVRR